MITIGSDIGGTFTDFVGIDESNGKIEVFKRLTTPHDPSEAVESGLREMAARQKKTATVMVHGTTLVINAVIERKGARTGLITTQGFRDVLEIGREKRFDAYDLQIEFPKPLVDRYLRVEVIERIHANGSVLQELDESSVAAAVKYLVGQGCESIAVCLLHSYVNPAHERRVGAIIRSLAPELSVTLSSDVLPEMKEYERTTTTTINAYAKPAISRYLSRLEQRARDLGSQGELLLMQSSGGLNSAAFACEFPVQIIESGPAAGTLGAAHYARLARLDKVLAFDMGGTTAKLALVVDGRATRTNDFEVAHVHRFKRGSGIPVRVPVVDLIEIGAGGGSIAHRTRVGTLQVGPESSSAVPGPACYGQGGSLPTVSDADLVLGYLDPDNFLGGRMTLDKAAAARAIETVLATPLGMSIEDAAFGIHAIVNENMAAAAKAYASDKGENPASCALVGFGGAGPVHSCDLAARLGIETVLIPPRAGVAAAFGMIVAPFTCDAVRSRRILLDRLTPETLSQMQQEMMQECQERLPRTINPEDVNHEFSADMRYRGQGYDVNAILRSATSNPGADAIAELRGSFEDAYRKLYGRVYSDSPIEIINLRLSASAKRKAADLAPEPKASRNNGKVGERQAFCPRQKTWLQFSIHKRDSIDPDVGFRGPAIVEENESTTVIPSGAVAFVDTYGSLIIRLAASRNQQ